MRVAVLVIAILFGHSLPVLGQDKSAAIPVSQVKQASRNSVPITPQDWARAGANNVSGVANAAGAGTVSNQSASKGRDGYYACNAYNIDTRVVYFSPIVILPYFDLAGQRRLEAHFAQYVAERFPGRYDGNAACPARNTRAEAESSKDRVKQSTVTLEQTWRELVDYVAPQ